MSRHCLSAQFSQHMTKCLRNMVSTPTVTRYICAFYSDWETRNGPGSPCTVASRHCWETLESGLKLIPTRTARKTSRHGLRMSEELSPVVQDQLPLWQMLLPHDGRGEPLLSLSTTPMKIAFDQSDYCLGSKRLPHPRRSTEVLFRRKDPPPVRLLDPRRRRRSNHITTRPLLHGQIQEG